MVIPPFRGLFAASPIGTHIPFYVKSTQDPDEPSLYYKDQWISGGAARQIRIAQLGGVDEMIKMLWNTATLSANAADGGNRRQLIKKVS